jgi:hypothetical protein
VISKVDIKFHNTNYEIKMENEYIELQILSFLEGRDFTPTLEISKEIFGKKATKKMINTHLYTLLRLGHVQKISEDDGTKPKWKLFYS